MILPPKKVPAFGSKFAFTSESKGYKKKSYGRKVNHGERQKCMKKSNKISCTTSFFRLRY